MLRTIRVMVARARLAGRRPPRAYWMLRYGPARALGLLKGRTRTVHPRVSLSTGDTARKPVILFYAINGSGLGHLTRCLSIASRLEGAMPVFVTTCRRAQVLDAYGIRSHYIESLRDLTVADPSTDREGWQQRLSATVRDLFEEYHPAALVTDCVAADEGVVRAWRTAPHVARIGIRRAYRLDGREHLVIARDREYDTLLVPHLPGEERVALPRGTEVRWVGRLLLVDRDGAMSRNEARAHLGLPPNAHCALVQLGAGEIGRGREAERVAVDALLAAGAHVVVTSYDAPAEMTDARVHRVQRFPMAEVLAAFDLCVAAAGYNTFTEMMHHGVPTIFVPNEHTVSDDQVARALRASRAGAAIAVREGDPAALRSAIARMTQDDDARARSSAAARELVPHNGAPDAARIIIERITSL